ncbi:hypothetical protein GH714_019659 [Hevea brasiliensis]|uniref:MULE transposase domain-containing protein n=1 Tax=Hevea brasiliensis TaxID=3981 RepID=A0A6A6K5T9_HEVBR|nr:hypothetical protein GH714_019659 [Hevea brasiliensis]
MWHLYRAKTIAKSQNIGEHANSYKKFKKYLYYLQKYNPGVVVKIELETRVKEEDDMVFKRLFISFEATKDGFTKGRRPLIGLDGCHLKGLYGGIFLSAVVLDGNRGALPLAFAFGESECLESWNFFLENLYHCTGDNRPWTFMSDRQKGLVEAVKEVFPTACHRFCYNVAAKMGKRREKDLRSSQTLPSSPSHSFSSSSSSEFEFTISLSPRKSSTAICPADELFYKGQLLPLHLSPRISMVRTILLASSSTSSSSDTTPPPLATLLAALMNPPRPSVAILSRLESVTLQDPVLSPKKMSSSGLTTPTLTFKAMFT